MDGRTHKKTHTGGHTLGEDIHIEGTNTQRDKGCLSELFITFTGLWNKLLYSDLGFFYLMKILNFSGIYYMSRHVTILIILHQGRMFLKFNCSGRDVISIYRKLILPSSSGPSK